VPQRFCDAVMQLTVVSDRFVCKKMPAPNSRQTISRDITLQSKTLHVETVMWCHRNGFALGPCQSSWLNSHPDKKNTFSVLAKGKYKVVNMTDITILIELNPNYVEGEGHMHRVRRIVSAPSETGQIEVEAPRDPTQSQLRQALNKVMRFDLGTMLEDPAGNPYFRKLIYEVQTLFNFKTDPTFDKLSCGGRWRFLPASLADGLVFKPDFMVDIYGSPTEKPTKLYISLSSTGRRKARQVINRTTTSPINVVEFHQLIKKITYVVAKRFWIKPDGFKGPWVHYNDMAPP
jgi:hypothetical protein